MSDHSTRPFSPSNSTKPTRSRAIPEVTTQTTSSPSPSEHQTFAETPQATTGQHLSSESSHPEIIVTNSPSPRTFTSHSPTANTTPPASQPKSRQHSLTPLQEPVIATMSSSASSPGNTSTAGSTSGSSNPTYQLPYAPFPYPMPANTRGSGQQDSKSK